MDALNRNVRYGEVVVVIPPGSAGPSDQGLIEHTSDEPLMSAEDRFCLFDIS